jgi:hypothetical protein
LFTKGGEKQKGPQRSQFLALNAKGGENIRPKAKGPHHHHFEIFKNFSNLYLNVFDHVQMVFIKIGKTLLNTKRRILFRGSFVSSKEEHLKQEEKISNLENASCNLTHMPLTICKKTLKKISKRICKNKTSGANVVQNVK